MQYNPIRTGLIYFSSAGCNRACSARVISLKAARPEKSFFFCRVNTRTEPNTIPKIEHMERVCIAYTTTNHVYFAGGSGGEVS